MAVEPAGRAKRGGGVARIAEQELVTETLSTRARNCIALAFQDGRLESLDGLRSMTNRQIMWVVRGRGQAQGIGKKTLKEVRSFFPSSQG